MAEAPERREIELLSPAEVAARANASARAAAATDRGGTGSSHWTILDGGVTTEQSVTQKKEWDAFDDMDWGDI